MRQCNEYVMSNMYKIETKAEQESNNIITPQECCGRLQRFSKNTNELPYDN